MLRTAEDGRDSGENVGGWRRFLNVNVQIHLERMGVEGGGTRIGACERCECILSGTAEATVK